jgi:hypothetical protein
LNVDINIFLPFTRFLSIYVQIISVVEQALTHPLQDLSLENGSGMSDMSNSLILDEGTDASLGNPSDREVNPSPTQPKTLQQEFSLINVNMPNVQMDVVRLFLLCCYFLVHLRDQTLLETKDLCITNKILNPSLLHLNI